MMEKKRFLDFLDMFDGGGAGQMGDRFEGGGLYSMIGNAFGSPYGSEDPERRAARQAFYGSENIGGAPMTSAPPPQVMPDRAPAQSPFEMFGGMEAAAYSPPAQSPMEMFGGMEAAAYTAPPPAGPSINPADAYGPAAMTFQDFVAGLGPVAQSASPDQLMTAYRQHMMGY